MASSCTPTTRPSQAICPRASIDHRYASSDRLASLNSGPSGGGTPCFDGLGKLPEIVQVATANLINNIPIDGLVAVHREVPESHSLLHSVCQGRTDHLQPIKRIEVLRYRRRRRDVGVPDEMGGQIDGQLNGPLEIEPDDVLQIRILRQVLGRSRRLAAIRSTQRRSDSSLAATRSRSMLAFVWPRSVDNTASRRPPHRPAGARVRHTLCGSCRESIDRW